MIEGETVLWGGRFPILIVTQYFLLSIICIYKIDYSIIYMLSISFLYLFLSDNGE